MLVSWDGLRPHYGTGRNPEHVRAHLPDRTRDPFAVGLELGPRVVAVGLEVAPHPVEEFEERGGGHLIGRRYPGHFAEDGPAGTPVEGVLQMGPIGVQLDAQGRDMAVVRLIHEVVGDSAEGVQGVGGTPLLRGEEAGCERKGAGVREGDAGALFRVRVRRRRLAEEARSPCGSDHEAGRRGSGKRTTTGRSVWVSVWSGEAGG